MIVNVTIEIRSLVSAAPKHFKLAMASRRAAFSGNTSLIATSSSMTLNRHDTQFVAIWSFFEASCAELSADTHTISGKNVAAEI